MLLKKGMIKPVDFKSLIKLGFSKSAKATCDGITEMNMKGQCILDSIALRETFPLGGMKIRSDVLKVALKSRVHLSGNCPLG